MKRVKITASAKMFATGLSITSVAIASCLFLTGACATAQPLCADLFTDQQISVIQDKSLDLEQSTTLVIPNRSGALRNAVNAVFNLNLKPADLSVTYEGPALSSHQLNFFIDFLQASAKQKLIVKIESSQNRLGYKSSRVINLMGVTQAIHRQSSIEKDVIAHSSITHNPNEYLVFTARDESKEIIAQQSAAGNAYRMAGDGIDKAWPDFLEKIRRSGKRMKYFETVHSHPYYELVASRTGSSALVVPDYLPFNLRDYVATVVRLRELKAHASNLVSANLITKTSATVPNGYTYSVFFDDSDDITNSSAKRLRELLQIFSVPID
jgi:hypothetical protein